MKDEYYGVIEERVSEKDWLGAEFELQRAPFGARSFKKNGEIQYDQTEVSRVSCTVHGALTAYSALTGYRFTLEERKELWDKAIALGANPSVGWYINSAVDLVRNYINSRDDLEHVASRRYRVGSYDYLMAMRLGYLPIIGFRGNREYKKDRDDDGILQGTSFVNTTFGHCLSVGYSIGDEYDQVVDNYPQRSTNLYKIPTYNWRKLVFNRVFFENAYIYYLT